MKQKKVEIIGLAVNQQMGILKACELVFDDKKVKSFKGEVGSGKTTLQKSVQLCTQGSKTLIDKQLYGKIDSEVKLLDGDLNIWVGCKSDKEGKLIYTLYTKDEEGKKIKEPVIDGVKATPSRYLETLQTELTWRLDELTSENPTVQKKILLSMYQFAFKKLGVIFDKNAPEYKNSILHKISEAEKNRSMRDAIRKQFGGIKEDLKDQGFDVERPDTIPVTVDINAIEQEIKEQERLKTIEETKSTSGRDENLAKIKTKVAELTNKAMSYNSQCKEIYEKELKFQKQYTEEIYEINETIDIIEKSIIRLKELKALPQDYFLVLNPNIGIVPDVDIPKYIDFDEKGIMVTKNHDIDICHEMIKLREDYTNVSKEQIVIDLTQFDDKIKELEDKKKSSLEINKIVQAVDSWYAWSDADSVVKELKNEYIKLLAKVDTGVKGLVIVPEENDGKLDIFLMYDGSYDSKYFTNPKGELIKLSAYSGTQKPVICLLIQNYLLSQKPKAMRYMFIDNIPIDKKTIELLESMGEELDLTIFLNITGDFIADNLNNGEILIEGGQVFFNGIEAPKPIVEKVKKKAKKIEKVKIEEKNDDNVPPLDF